MNYDHEEDVGMYVHLMGYPKTLIPAVTMILNDQFCGHKAHMAHVMKVTDDYATVFDTDYSRIHDTLHEFVGRYIMRSVFGVIKAHNWGTDKTPKITGMLLEFIFRDGAEDQGQRFENVAGNLTEYVMKAFNALH